MARFNDILQSFINGEVSPRMYGRTDTDIYRRACKNLKNMKVIPQGGARRRMGTEFITDNVINTGSIKAISENCALFDFIYSDTEKYTVIFPGLLLETPAPAAYNFVYMLNQSTGALFTVDVDFSLYDRSASNTLRLTSKLRDIDVLRRLQSAQNGNIMVFTHGEMPPFVLRREAENKFELRTFYDTVALGITGGVVARAVPYQNQNISSITMSWAANTGATTLTASASYFTEDMVGAWFAVQDSGVLGVSYVTGYTSATQVSVSVIATIPVAAVGANSSTQWYESAWSDERGWPRACAFWQSTLCFGGSETFPDTIWKSQVADIYEFNSETLLDLTGTATAEDTFDASIASSKAARITGMAPSNQSLIVNTEEREYFIFSFDHVSIDIRTNSSVGGAYVQSVNANETHVFVQNGGRDVYRMVYDDRIQGYQAESIGFLAEHIFKKSQDVYTDSGVPELVKIVYQKRPDSMVWGLDKNGYLYACTLKTQGGVVAWHRVELGGSTSTGIPKVLSIASVPSREGNEDDLMLLVKREINSTDVVFLEKLRPDWWESSLNPDVDTKYRLPVFMDACKIFRPSTALTFYASMASDGDATYSTGTGTATETDTVTYERGWAKFNASSYIDYDGTSNADTAQVGCIRFKWKRTQTGVTDRMFTICKASGDQDNLITMDWDSLDQIGIGVNDSSGSSIISTAFGTIEEQQYGKEYLFELNYDLTNGATRLFVNGKQLGNTLTNTGTRDTSIDLIRLGATFDAGTITSNRSAISEFAIFNTVQHTADYEPFEVQPKTTTIYGLEYLEGETVKVLADGKNLGSKTVSSGTITLSDTYDTVIVGLPYEHLLEPLPPNFGGAIGSRQGQTARLDRVIGRFESTAACEVGPDSGSTDAILFRPSTTPLTDPIPLFTGDKETRIEGPYDLNPTVVYKGSDPLPCNITCLILRGVTNE